jgi:hypothetical protein
MDLPARILGTATATAIATRNATAVLLIGKDRFSRSDLAAVACFNYVAALNLSRALADLKVRSTADVFERIGPIALAVPHVGAVALAVLGAAFQCKGLGGDHPLEAWVTRHRQADQRKTFVTFHTVKSHAADARAATAERKTAKTRHDARRHTAHRLRVDRHRARHERAIAE